MGSQNHGIFRRWRNGHLQKFVAEFFFPTSPNDLKILQYFLTYIGRFVGIFDLIHIYLGIVKSFQTLHVHMNNAG